MNILFASMHGAAAKEITLLATKSNNKIFFPLKGNKYITTATVTGDINVIEKYGGKVIKEDEKFVDLWSSNFFDCIIVSTSEQITDYRQNLAKIKNKPLVIRHGANSFDRFRKAKVKNFISPSLEAIKMMSGTHAFLNRKLIYWEEWPKPTDVSVRENFHSYIHFYEKHWNREYKIFHNLRRFARRKGISLENYGKGTENGLINDVGTMLKSRGTIHIKGGQVCCNAVIKSLALGTPVVTDMTSFQKCFLDQVQGVDIKSPREIYIEMKKLQTNNEYWQKKSSKIYELSKKQFSYSSELGEGFNKFLATLRK